MDSKSTGFVLKGYFILVPNLYVIMTFSLKFLDFYPIVYHKYPNGFNIHGVIKK